MVKGQSPRHVWRYASQDVDHCLRCQRSYHRRADGAHGPFYCVPTPGWLRAHPDDDRKER